MTPNKTVLLLAASGLALTLGACKVDNRPLLARDSAPAYADAGGLPQPGLPGDPAYGAPNYGANAYPASYLPPARAYPYAERAYGLDRAFYRTPPSYGFDYADEQPWAWQAADDSLMFAEPYDDGYRSYYYAPGADYPYFVRDPNYGYALGQGGVLLALFDAAGALLSGDDYDRYAPMARQYWSRGYDLHSAYGRAPRFAVDPAVWSQRAPRIEQFQQTWIAAPERQRAWRQWRASAGPRVLQRFDARRGDRVAAFDPGRHDNGLHLGWDRGRHQGWDRHGGPREFAAAAPPPARFEPPPMERGDRGDRGHRDHGHAPPPPRFEAPSAMGHGRDAAARAPAPRFEPAPAVQAAMHGEGRGGHGGGEGRAFAQAQPQQQPQPQPQHDGGQGHGGGPSHGQDKGQGQGKGQDKHDQGGGHRHGG